MCVSVNECVFVCQENAVGQVMRVNIPLSWYRIPSQHASACVPGSGLSKPGARVMERSHYGACRPGFHPCSTAGAPPLEAGGPHNVVQMCVCVCTVGSWEHGSFNLWVRGVVGWKQIMILFPLCPWLTVSGVRRISITAPALTPIFQVCHAVACNGQNFPSGGLDWPFGITKNITERDLYILQIATAPNVDSKSVYWNAKCVYLLWV